MITIRKYQAGDEIALREIFFNTIGHVNIKDYSLSQVQAWAPQDYDEQAWCQRIQAINPFVALIEQQIVGYADIQADGYIDHFFCHQQHQGKGIGKTIMQTLFATAKTSAIKRLHAQVSISAKPFFERFGFQVIKQQQVHVRGQSLTNFMMEKYNEWDK